MATWCAMTSIDDAAVSETGRRFTPGRILMGLIFFGSFGIWGYIFSGQAARTPPDLLNDDSFSVAAEARCVVANEIVASMPNAIAAEDNVDRAGQVRANTAVYAEMVADLDTLRSEPAIVLDERDTEMTAEWIADWERFLADRLDYADRLEDDELAVFYVAASDGGERLERRITRFADTNTMESCGTPSDVG